MMRTLLTTFLVACMVVIGATTFTHSVQAQALTGSCTAEGGVQGHFEGEGADQKCVAGAASPDSATASYSGAPAATPIIDPPGAKLEGWLAQIMSIIMTLFAWLLGVAAITLDNAVYFTVVTMGGWVNELSAIGVAWRILRDIGNIVLIFGFLAVGISVILDSEWYGGGYKLLPVLLIAAVTLNFSLFVSEAIIDTGNLFATQFYTQINGGDPATPKNYTSDLTSEGISDKIMSQLGLQTLYSDAIRNPKVFDTGDSAVIAFLGIFLFIVAAFVMFSLAFILVARFVALIFLIIVSPIGFAGLAVPKLSGVAKQWWSTLFEQTITAPILLLMLYIALAVITDVNFLTGFGVSGAAASGAWTGTTGNANLIGFAGILLSFLVAMGLLLGVTVLSKKLSAFGASAATKWGGRASFGATAYIGSGAVGTFFGGTRRLAQRYAPTSRYTRGYSRVANFAENRTMDVRAIPGVGAGLSFASAGEAAAPIGASAGNRTRQGREWWRNTSQTSSRTVDQQTRLDRLRASTDAKEIKTLLGNSSDKELESSEMQKILKNNDLAVAMLSQAKFDKLMSSEVLSDAEKSALKGQRTKGLIAHYSNPTEAKKLSGADVGKLPDDVLADSGVHANLNVKQINAIMKADAISDATATTIGNHLRGDPTFQTYLLALMSTNPHQADGIKTYWRI